jgi:hypothetical protein
MKITARDGREHRSRPLRQLKPEVLRVKRDGTIDILDLVANHRRLRICREKCSLAAVRLRH